MDPIDTDDAPLIPARTRAVLAWVVILGSVAYIAGHYLSQSLTPVEQVTNPAASPSVSLKLVSLYAVGAARVLPSPPAPGSPDPVEQLIPAVEKAALTPLDKVREVPVLAELRGASAATARLQQLKEQIRDAELQRDIGILQKIYTDGPAALTPAERERVARRHDWFGRLALSFGLATDNPARNSVLAPARRTLLASIGALVLGGGAMVAGLVLLVFMIVRLADRKLPLAYRPGAGDASPFLEMFAAYLGGTVLIGLFLKHLASAPRFGPFALLLSALPVALALLWPRLRGVPPEQWRYAFGWHTGRGALREMGFGLIGYVAGLPILGLGLVVCLFLSKLTGATPVHPIVNEAAGGPAKVAMLFALACVWAPLIEESLFRGAFFHALRSRHGWLLSSLIVSLIFAALHPQGLVALPVLGAIAMVLAAIREWRGTILASAAAHALNNGIAMILLVMTLN